MIHRIIEFSAKNKFIVIFFAVAAIIGAVYCIRNMPLDAIPDLSDTQVIIYSQWDRSPDIIEQQVTYPIVTAMLGAPKVKAIRGFSDFGFSYVYIIFKDGTDIYWARSRTVEYLSKITAKLPQGVQMEIGPDATSVGWVYQYALVDKSGNNSLADLRSFQDWYLRYWLQSVPGVAEVASVGGFQKQYQVNVNPNALLAYNIPLTKVVEAVRQSNNDVGARLLEMSGTEYMIRAKGYIKSPAGFGKYGYRHRRPRHACTDKECCRCCARPGYTPGHCRLGRRGGHGRRNCHYAAGGKRTQRDKPRQGKNRRDKAVAAERR